MPGVTLESIQRTISEYKAVSTCDNAFKSVLSMYINADPQLSNDECINGLKDDLPVEMLFQKEMLLGPTTLFRVLRDYLVLKGFEYVQYPGSNRINRGIAHSFFDAMDREYALGCIDALRNPQSTSDDNSQVIASFGSNITSATGFDERKLAHSIAQRFRKDERFTGKLGEDINEFLSNYDEASLDYNLSLSQKFRYFHNLFHGEAKRFYRDEVLPSCDSYRSAASKMIAEYNNITRQNRIRQYLQTVKLSKIIEKESCDVSEGLEKLRNIITSFAPQGPLSYRSEEAKVEYLYNAVSGFDWSTPALTQCYANDPPWKFQQLYTALDSAWLQEQRREQMKRKENFSNPEPILWQSQGMYGVPRTMNSSDEHERHHYTDGKKIRCYNCNEFGHKMWDCAKPRNLTKNIHSIMKKSPLGSQKILFELCKQFDEHGIEESEDEMENGESSKQVNVVDDLHAISYYSNCDQEDF